METESHPTRQKILESALRLFSEKGYKATTVRDIAADVGIRAGAIYNHFKNKEEILKTLVTQMMDSALTQLFPSGSEALDHTKGKSVLLRLASTFKLIGFDSRNEALFRLMMQELFKNGEIRDLYQEKFYQQNVRELSAIFFKMMQDGMIRSSDPLMLANEFFAPLFFYQMQVLLLKIDGKSTSSAATLFEKHVDWFWEAIRIPGDDRSGTLF
ncbi:TetR/AcrR family transcriptional regulator [Nitratifractor sp.]